MQINTINITVRAFLIAALSLAAVAPVATGCAVIDVQDAEAGKGTIVVPLAQTGPDGALYQLLNATFEIDGPDGTELVSGDLHATLNLSLSAGDYTIRLLDGWEMWRAPDPDMTAEQVSAVLGTVNPITLRVVPDQTETLSFGFIVLDPQGDVIPPGGVEIDFGVATGPRMFVGGVTIHEATGELAPYSMRTLDFHIYFELFTSFARFTPDGQRDLMFSAGRSFSTPVAAEFSNDEVGILSDVVGPALAGGNLEYHLTQRFDGTIELYGTLVGASPPYTTFAFGPVPVSAPVDSNFFPVDATIYNAVAPFTMSTSFDGGEATLSGFLDLSYLLPQ